MSKKKGLNLKIKEVEDKMLSYKEQKDIMIRIIENNKSIAKKEKMIQEAQAKLLEFWAVYPSELVPYDKP